jgi:hypothetical protein
MTPIGASPTPQCPTVQSLSEIKRTRPRPTRHSAVNPISGAERKAVDSGRGWHDLLRYGTHLRVEESPR